MPFKGPLIDQENDPDNKLRKKPSKASWFFTINDLTILMILKFSLIRQQHLTLTFLTKLRQRLV